MTKLSKFNGAHDLFDRMKIPSLDVYTSNVSINSIDITKKEASEGIEFNNDGVYLEINGNWQRGYMYIKEASVQKWGFPKFHILECKTILDQKAKNYFDNHYFWGNTPTVDLTDRNTGEKHNNISLDLCRNCKKELHENTGENIHNTEGFHALLDINDEKITENTETIETDIFGRPLNWREISTAYRNTQNFTCEDCGFGGPQLKGNLDKRFMQTHHIKPHELLNTHTDNLKCLCILCHSEQDAIHRKNFSNKGEQKKIENFISKYHKELEGVNNSYLKKYSMMV